MKTKRLSFIMSILLAAILLLGTECLLPARANAAFALSLTITESWDSDQVSFTVENPFDEDIMEFAIGNNDAGSAWINMGVENPPPVDWYGTIAWKDGNSWMAVDPSETVPRVLAWMENVENFDNYDHAFLYTSWAYDETAHYGAALNSAFTNGFEGSTDLLASPFAAYSFSGSTITGETNTVPVPGAVLLLGSGMIGLVGLKRKLAI